MVACTVLCCIWIKHTPFCIELWTYHSYFSVACRTICPAFPFLKVFFIQLRRLIWMHRRLVRNASGFVISQQCKLVKAVCWRKHTSELWGKLAFLVVVSSGATAKEHPICGCSLGLDTRFPAELNPEWLGALFLQHWYRIAGGWEGLLKKNICLWGWSWILSIWFRS